ncbi:MAG: DUF2520 domain-containing protein [Deltaproteobacteria bacterium]|nr:DUF2520 domain-containing protein [Deltaproteobacteria bacterium]MBW2405279.1 DUF2520 domain-containing protein [Deltaproteobacteria bacterium]MBW2545950.1 DUF2520 domain-containing protein [Deltaproteobacteria bacterium]MBW2717617.1 DUF2520 domain-containing protein [Deltaproteobacteria bacterium]
MNILIIGRGRVGRALHRSLRSHEQHAVIAAGRRWKPSSVQRADAVILAVPDGAIETVAERVARDLSPSATVLHCAGARGTGELASCERRGAAVGVMHPLVSFPSKRSNPSLRGTTFTVGGSRRAVATSRRLALACDARIVVAQTGDASYHAAAALVANGAAALAFVSVGVLERLGFEKRAAERAIGGLLKSVGENVQSLGVPGALTGPIARGDTEAVVNHRHALRRVGRDALPAYDAVVPVIVKCARAAGLSRVKASKIVGATRE